MQLNNEEICEACGHIMLYWNIRSNCTLLKCPQCYHIKRDPELCAAHAREYAWGGSELFDKIRAVLTLNRLQKLLPQNRKLTVLEIGFGSGTMLSTFLKKGHNVSGVDVGYLGIHINDSLKKYGTLCFGKVENIDLPEDTFDLVYGIHVIEHVDNPSIVFKKCYAALKNGGLLYLITPNASSKGLAIFRDSWWNLEDPTHQRFFSPQSITVMLKKERFQKIETKIPLWDSLTLEVNSLLRLMNRNPMERGVLGSKFTKLLDAVILPFAIAARIFYPAISPSLQITAYKSRPENKL